MNNIELSIIIVNYNGENFLRECFSSIKKHCKGIAYEIIVLDNASTDDSINTIKKDYPHIKLITNVKNAGFSKGNNIAIKRSLGKKILLLNNDTVLQSHLRPALNIINREDVGTIGFKMFGKNLEYRKSAGRFPNPVRLLKLSKLYMKGKGFNTGNFVEKQPIEVDWIEGSFLLTKRSLWERLNGLDESYFMYVEDIDYCKRLSLLNKKRLFFPRCSYIHYGGYSNNREDLLKKGLSKYINKFNTGLIKWLNLAFLNINFFLKNVKKKYTKIA